MPGMSKTGGTKKVQKALMGAESRYGKKAKGVSRSNKGNRAGSNKTGTRRKGAK